MAIHDPYCNGKGGKTAVSHTKAPCPRKGAAVAEFAIVVPALLLLMLGTIDVGQYINTAQTVSDAAREGARLAARNGTLNVATVENWVRDYVANSYPGVSTENVAAAMDVKVTNSGTEVAAGDLSALSSGTPLEVEITLNFNAVRWMNGVLFSHDRMLQTTSVARRE